MNKEKNKKQKPQTARKTAKAKKTSGNKSDPKSPFPTIDGVEIYCSHTAIVPIGEMMPNPKNPNRHPDEQIRRLAKIIKGNGFRRVITVSDRSGMIVVGHARLEAAQKLGLSSVPIDVQHYRSAAAEHADMVADNRIPELAEMDGDALATILSETDTGDIDIELTGYSGDELEKILTEAPEPGEPDPDPGPSSHTPGSISILVDPDNERNVREWLANGEETTKDGMGRGVLRRMGLIKD